VARVLIDEDLPCSTAGAQRQAEHAAIDVRDVGLRGSSDAAGFAYAQSQQLALLRPDMGFANLLLFPPGTHAGIGVLRVPNELPTTELAGQQDRLST